MLLINKTKTGIEIRLTKVLKGGIPKYVFNKEIIEKLKTNKNFFLVVDFMFNTVVNMSMYRYASIKIHGIPFKSINS